MTNTSFHPQKHQPQHNPYDQNSPFSFLPSFSSLWHRCNRTKERMKKKILYTSLKFCKKDEKKLRCYRQLVLHLNVWKMVDYSGFKLRSTISKELFRSCACSCTFFYFIIIFLLYKIISKEPEIYIESLSFCCEKLLYTKYIIYIYIYIYCCC